MSVPPIKNFEVYRKLSVVEATLDLQPASNLTETHGLVYLASIITARARDHLTRLIHRAQRFRAKPLYCDTDSLVYKVPAGERDPFAEQRGGHLGGLKLEAEFTFWQAWAPKFYRGV